MEISLGRWNTKKFLGRRSYLLYPKKKGIQKDPRLFEKYFSLKHALPSPAGNRACGFFLKTSNLIVLGLKKLEKTWSPILSIKKQGKDPRDRDYSDKWKLSYNVSIKPTLSRPAGNRACGFFPSRRPIWALWRPKSPKRASWEKVWWLDFLKTSNLSFLAAKKLKLDVLRK